MRNPAKGLLGAWLALTGCCLQTGPDVQSPSSGQPAEATSGGGATSAGSSSGGLTSGGTSGSGPNCPHAAPPSGCTPHQAPCSSNDNLCPPVVSCCFGSACGVVGYPCCTNEDCCGGNICSGTTGLCIIDDTIMWCTQGADCATDRCENDQCVCAQIGQACSVDTNCCSGVCSKSLCATNMTLGMGCGPQKQCASTESCVNGSCCIPNVSTEFCQDDGDCCAGDCQSGLCAQEEGGPCSVQTDCYPGWICVNGGCVAR